MTRPADYYFPGLDPAETRPVLVRYQYATAGVTLGRLAGAYALG